MNIQATPKKPVVAIVGSGISGLVCAYLLRQHYDVHLFESQANFGGHTATTQVKLNDQIYPVNTGFIVYNDWTYPHFIQLMDELGVATEASDMSFSVKCDVSGMEYNGQDINSLFARRQNLINPSFWRMILDILRFNRETRSEIEAHNRNEDQFDPTETLGSYLKRKRYGDYFRRYYIIPMGAAIWSSGETSMMEFPVLFFLRFFNNHGLLSVNDRPQWRVISGGSQTYVRALLSHLPQEQLHTNTAVTSIKRDEEGIKLTLKDTSQESLTSLTGDLKPQDRQFEADHVILACHSDQALAMLEQATPDEQRILGAIPYQDNSVILHTDSSLLPVNKRAWASWNYHMDSGDDHTVAVTYHMNRLQNFHEAPEEFCVTLNQPEAIDPRKIIKRFNYAHPVFTVEGIQAQHQHHLISNHSSTHQRTHYCGAYWFNGFHEDGVNSALRVCRELGVQWPPRQGTSTPYTNISEPSVAADVKTAELGQ